jgi:hypothetical protein
MLDKNVRNHEPQKISYLLTFAENISKSTGLNLHSNSLSNSTPNFLSSRQKRSLTGYSKMQGSIILI